MADEEWRSVADYTDGFMAEAAVERLTLNDVPCFIRSNAHVPGLGSAFSVRVPPDLEAQAKSLLENARLTDSELTDLAMSLPPEEPPDA